jgi:hypothetical protein
MRWYVLPLLLSLFFLSCSEDDSLAGPPPLAKTTIDLQFGFRSRGVDILADSNRIFFALMDSAELLAGPQASFVTYLSQGRHVLIVRRLTFASSPPPFSDTLTLVLSSLHDCFVGLQIAEGDTVAMVVQDHPFGYLKTAFK